MRIKIGTVVSKKATSTLSKRFVDEFKIKNKFGQRIERASARLEAVIKSQVRRELLKTSVIKNLTKPPIGVRGYDLEAEFGLQSGTGKKVAEFMVDVIVDKSVKIRVIEKDYYRNTRDFPSMDITIAVDYLQNKLYERQIEETLIYVSQSTKTRKRRNAKGDIVKKKVTKDTEVIPYGRWIMNAGRGDKILFETNPSMKEYGILYGLSKKAMGFSRSGRALMVKQIKRRRHGDDAPATVDPRLRIIDRKYSFPVGAKPKGGAKNFVHEVQKSKALKDFVLKKLKDLTRKEFRKYSKRK